MSKHVEAEGGELLIESSNGYSAIIPKNMAAWVKEHIKSGNHAVVDDYVKRLQEMKPNIKAPVKTIVEADATRTTFVKPVYGEATERPIAKTQSVTERIEALPLNPFGVGLIMSKRNKK